MHPALAMQATQLTAHLTHTLQAHLRARLYAELKGSSDGGDPLAALPPGRGPPSLHNHVLNCLVAEHLLVRRLKYSLSVFLVESGSGALPQLPCADVLRLVGVLPESSVHTLLMAAPGHKGGSDESDASSSSGSPPALSLAERMVAALGALGGRVTTAAAACQTGEDSGAPSPLQLGQRLAAIEDEYRRKSTQLEAAAAERLEQRMAAYQAECDTRCAAQLQDRLAALREGELAAVRGHEAEAHARALEAERGALQAAHLQRLAALRAAEDELAERGRRAQREQDALREQHLRRLRAEEERLAAWKADSEAKAAAQDAAARQRLQAAKAAAQQAETQHAAAERRLSTLLAEVQAREEVRSGRKQPRRQSWAALGRCRRSSRQRCRSRAPCASSWPPTARGTKCKSRSCGRRWRRCSSAQRGHLQQRRAPRCPQPRPLGCRLPCAAWCSGQMSCRRRSRHAVDGNGCGRAARQRQRGCWTRCVPA